MPRHIWAWATILAFAAMIGGMLGVCYPPKPMEEESLIASLSSFVGSMPGLLQAQVQGFSVFLPNRAVKSWPVGYPVMLPSKPVACMTVWKDQRSLPTPCAN